VTKKKLTVLFIVLTVLVIAGWDVYAIMTGGVESSISHTMIEWSYKYPIFTFMMGIICGHLFWRMSDTKTTEKISDFVHGTVDDSNKGTGGGS
jgi:hypothetical protein